MISIFENKEEKMIKSHLGRLVKLAKADGEFHKKEQKLIVKIGKHYGLDLETIEDIMYHTKQFDSQIPEDKDICFYQLLDFITLIAEDGHITDEEQSLYMSLGTQLGFKKPILGLLLEKIARDLEAGLPKDKIKSDCESLIAY